MSAAPIKIAIAGALGRMGQAVAAAVQADPALILVARFDRPDAQGEGLVSAAQALAACDVIIDFTTPAASAALAEQAAGKGVALVLGSTGFDAAQIAAVAQAAKTTAIVRAGNFSLGLNMLMGLVAQAARALPADGYDIEIFEAHHRRKVDAPSGTALMLGEAAAKGRGVSLSQVARHARDGITGERPVEEIGFSVLRGGGIIGEHSVTFAADDEILTLSHSARDRGLFARGAAAAARWVAGRPAGEYDMQDVLGFSKER
ncbi:MAG: 4-hydroxy-tetrahydrodipicolinate reductase [Alphaproteobacteria bacterium]|nr:4-hydroxy-tetrahydrodipicolinate reductase [Alphaproteobacteria bacterium]MBU1514238.1 4-hydroxy-tetrahydrodipicolinate reductase [Alphaproteobacteria bacterium]MBU2093316.1 4-hydroxy-tetrahydrodipicolinate reductase [Alphaproteobacteria bacterium]MBU2153407.1 4-hydroxy-tetrahydrodipicolinate reductase [Alphaproteobacteria bacterium]MBU2307098.1 4-hydroxy-tetrahydrodipicolinate reductase [Alphaproteobacteria bacterium]